MGIAYLASEDGQRIQKKAYEEIMKVYPDGNAWEKCLVEENVPYVTALVKETLRFWTVIPVCLPRESTKDIEWNGATIPAGTTFFMVRFPAYSYVPAIGLGSPLTRMPGRPIMTRIISSKQTSLSRSGTLSSVRVPGPPITDTALALVCALDHTWRTGSSTQPSCV